MRKVFLHLVHGCAYTGFSLVAAQSESTDETDFATMVDPAERTYPTTVTTTLSTTRTGASGAVTIDHVTVIDPWPVSPDPISVPFTKTETAVTQRAIVTMTGDSAVTATATMTATSTWILWPIQIFDMPPSAPPDCPGPGGCAYRTVKPHWRCEELKRETRCATQCLLKDWLWWCSSNGTSTHVDGASTFPPYLGRICADGGDTSEAGYEAVLEPCDHTDFKPGCPLCPDEEDEGDDVDLED